MTNVFSDLAKHFGGQVATAIALGVTQGTVSGWIRGVHGCSADVALIAERKTGGKFLAQQLRPSLAEAPPTLNANLRDTSTVDQSCEPAVNSSSSRDGSKLDPPEALE